MVTNSKEIIEKLEELSSEITEKLQELNSKIEQLYDLNYDRYDDLSDWKYNEDELFLSDELTNVLDELESVLYTLEYLNRPIIEGTLHKKTNGKYAVKEIELSCGRAIEYIECDGKHEKSERNGESVPIPYWKKSRIEHNGKDYYIYSAKELETIENLIVRVRGY